METFSIHYENKADLLRQLRSALIEREEWITPKELGNRYKVMSQTLTQRLTRWEKEGLVELVAQCGATGRIKLLKLTPELRALMDSMK